ncbi:hypothetical protein GJ688_02000 [Heliobacillus mobilis]|uniref:Head decoration protein n=1 Tax=Heliobacterium mobile TaxID=28064 RepID=A0A6I3SDH8_HELMO|nr:hypothetical protein [Heliobacterium mobile]MTV47755.1 hypothetical protein [Heliobacterium mobile]
MTNIGLKETQFTTPKNIWFSTQGRRFSTLTIDASAVTANEEGKKIILAGTALAKKSNGKFAPYVAEQWGSTLNGPVFYVDRDIDVTSGDQVVNGAYSGVLRASRLATAPDANIKGAMPSMEFR